MESEDIITSKTEEEDNSTLSKAQQKKLFTVESSEMEEIDKKEEKLEVQEGLLEDISNSENLALEEIEEEKKDEVISEDIEEKREPKNITISIDDSMLVESGLEIQYTSLQLNNFPISYPNFSNELSFNEVISIGTSAIKIGETLLNNTSLKILVYDKFKLLEIKTREFKVALSIDLRFRQ